jgi:hypothetical protein
VFGIAIPVAVFAGAGGYATPAMFADGFARAITISGALALTGSIVALGLPGRQRQVVEEEVRSPVGAPG